MTATNAILQYYVDYALSIGRARFGVAPYVYDQVWSPTDPTVGADCSAAVGTILDAVTLGPVRMVWQREVATTSWPANPAPGTIGPYGTVAIASYTDLPADAPMLICIHHEAGGATDHMNCVLAGTIIESNGTSGAVTGSNATQPGDPYWTDYWYLPGPVLPTCGFGVDYSGGQAGGANLAAAGYSFACRYVTDGGSGFSTKLLTASEASDLQDNDIAVVANWEYGAQQALGGYPQGVADAKAALANAQAAGMPAGRPIYFSIDFDEPDDPATLQAIAFYFQGVASVLGLGATGAYGGYWALSRLLDAGLITWAWQTTAWSWTGACTQTPMLDPRINIYQDGGNVVNVAGIQCDVDVATTRDYGQWNYTGGLLMALTDQQQQQIYDALCTPLTSQSPFRAPGEAAIWTVPALTHNDDGFTHPMYVGWAAGLGDPVSLQVLNTVATMSDPTRANDSALAQKILASIGEPTPAPQPAPTDGKAPAAVPSKLKANLHTVTTVVGIVITAGSWLAAHDQIFSTSVAGVITGIVGAAVTLNNFLVKEEQAVS